MSFDFLKNSREGSVGAIIRRKSEQEFYIIEFYTDKIKVRRRNGPKMELVSNYKGFSMSKSVWYTTKIIFDGNNLNVWCQKSNTVPIHILKDV